jgi:hypothetical protein
MVIIKSDVCTINTLMSVNDASRNVIDHCRVMLHIVASLTDYSTGIIFDHMFKVQATGFFSK